MRTIPCPLSAAAKKYGSETAIIAGSLELSYLDLNARVEKTRAFLQEAGVGPSDRVAVLSKNSPEYLVVLIALWRIGASACLLSVRDPESVITEQLKELEAGYLIAQKPYRAGIKGIDINSILNIASFEDTDLPLQDEVIQLDAEATIMFTSGSSSSPKAVVHTFGSHYFNAKGSNENIHVGPGDRWLLSLPLYHVSGLSILFRVLLGGGGMIIPEDPKDIVRVIEERRVTHLSLVAAQLFHLLRDKGLAEHLKDLKAILLGGSMVPETLLRKAEEWRLPLYISYGLTETASQVATSGAKEKTSASRQKAKVLNYREVKISSDGEILVRGEVLFLGYWKQGKIFSPCTRGGWFATGDLGAINNEGYLTVYARKDNMFISGGENISPEEIERELLNIEQIEQAVVIPVENEDLGQMPEAFVKLKQNEGISVQAIICNVERKLPRFKIPRQFYLWPDNNDTAGIKINRNAFIDLVRNKKDQLKTIKN